MKAHVFQHSRAGVKARLWSARIRLEGWLKDRTVALHVTDKRVAEQKLEKLIQELEREAAGILAPKLMRDAAQMPIAEHLKAFLADLQANRCSGATISKYRNSISLLCKRCRWAMVKDITPESFTVWRVKSALRPKTLNDLLASISRFLNWMEGQRYILANPLKHLGSVSDHSPREFRRALLPQDAQKLLNAAAPHRAVVYLTILYTGLRSAEMKGLTWGDFDLEASQPCVRVPSSISKNRRASVHGLHGELVVALKKMRPVDAKATDWVFKGLVPRVPTFKKDLAAAGIPFKDENGRRMDIHALRKTFGTMLAVSGASLRTCMELMRHSESRLTEKVYTDASHLPLQSALNALPSLNIPVSNTPRRTLSGVFGGLPGAFRVANSRKDRLSQAPAIGSSRHEKAAGDASSRLSKMERAKRLELSTSTLARWCSTN